MTKNHTRNIKRMESILRLNQMVTLMDMQMAMLMVLLMVLAQLLHVSKLIESLIKSSLIIGDIF